MSDDKPGGPAFPLLFQPVGGIKIDGIGACGMTLLDYFAGQALAGICAANPKVGNHTWDEARTVMARCAYAQAAAMLAQKRRREGNQDDD